MTQVDDTLAINGGPPVKRDAFGTGRRYDDHELRDLKSAIDQDELFYFYGSKTSEFCDQAKDYFGVSYCSTASSGTAAIHAAVASLEIEPGYEVITAPITDYGTVVGLLYQNLIPVFADVDPYTYNVTADTIRAKMTDRTRAILVVHLAGNPCEMEAIMALAREHGLPVIEDVAQSYNAIYRGRKAGTIGDLGCFSLNGFKHISCGDGGFVLTDSEALFHQCHNYADKFYDRHGRGVRMSRLAPCYRITELQSSVAIAQLGKLDTITSTRNRHGDRLTEIIADCPGVTPHGVHPHNRSSYWFYMFRLDLERLTVSRDEFAETLRAEGIPCGSGYIPGPIYMESVFTNQSFFPGGVWPAQRIAGKTYEYGEGLCPVAEQVLQTAITLQIKEFFTAEDIEAMGRGVRKVAKAFEKQ